MRQVRLSYGIVYSANLIELSQIVKNIQVVIGTGRPKLVPRCRSETRAIKLVSGGSTESFCAFICLRILVGRYFRCRFCLR